MPASSRSLGDAVGAALGAGENNHPRHFRVVEQFDQHVPLLRRIDEDDAVLDAIGGLGGRRHRDLDRIVQQFARKRANVGRHRRREEEVLPLLRQFAHDAADRLDEAEVEHPVDFVEHQELDGAQVGDARVDMVQQPAGSRHQHIEALAKRADLGAMRHAAEYDCDLERERSGEVAEALRDLACEFPRRAEHEHARAALRRRAADRPQACGEWAAQRPQSCRCPSGRCRSGRGLSSAAGSPGPESGSDAHNRAWPARE